MAWLSVSGAEIAEKRSLGIARAYNLVSFRYIFLKKKERKKKEKEKRKNSISVHKITSMYEYYLPCVFQRDVDFLSVRSR